jgi:hypothetical protein
VDSGVGIPNETLTEINERLDNPPVMDVSVSRHMGLFAVGRLAERHGIRVRLRARSPQGIIAMVWLPDAILQENDRAFGRRHPALRQIGVPGRRTMGATSRSSLPAQAAPEVAAPPREIPALPREATTRVAAASSKWFSDPRGQADASAGSNGTSHGALGGNSAFGGKGAFGGGGAFGGNSAVGASGLPSRSAEQPGGAVQYPAAAQVMGDPVYGDKTSTGLPVRVPQANLMPGSIEGAGRADTVTPGQQSDHRDGQHSAQHQQWQQRTPEIARSRMSGFQRGVRRGQRPAPRAGEGIDR